MIKPRWITILTMIGLLALFLPGCSGQNAKAPETSGQNSTFPMTITDSAGRTVTIASEPQRLVSLSPSNTEILFALGLGNKIAGVTSYCNYPPEATRCPQIGGFSNPNVEKIVAQKPDLVFAADRHGKETSQLEQLGIPVIVVTAPHLDDISPAIRMIGQACGVPDLAKIEGQKIDDKIAAIRTAVGNKPDRPLVFYQLFNEPITTIGPNTIINDLIVTCGGVNLSADAAADYPQYSQEAIVARNPDIIIQCAAHGSYEADVSTYQSGWQSVKAVQQQKIYAINGDISTRTGPRIVEALDAFLRVIHPELAAVQ